MAQHIVVIGAGPAGLIAAEMLAQAGMAVTVFDRMASAGRKFLMAGRGGLNLTHSEPLADLIARYGDAAGFLAPHIHAFPPDALIAWAHGLGQETFTGSSGRVFPKTMKASPLLRAWLARLAGLGVTFRLQHAWRGWDGEGQLLFSDAADGKVAVRADATLLALGGASWPRLGSDGHWVPLLAARGVAMVPFRPANCGFVTTLDPSFHQKFQGQPLSGVALSHGSARVRGEAVITAYGIEGGAVYALSRPLREAIDADGAAEILIDLRPGMDIAAVTARLQRPRGKESLSNFLRKALSLPPAAIALLRAAHGGAVSDDAARLALQVKAVPVRLSSPAGMARAISVAGGVARHAVDENLMLKALPGTFVVGEMIDWEAPTGGYLLQACFATGAAAARGILARVGRS